MAPGLSENLSLGNCCYSASNSGSTVVLFSRRILKMGSLPETVPRSSGDKEPNSRMAAFCSSVFFGAHPAC